MSPLIHIKNSPLKDIWAIFIHPFPSVVRCFAIETFDASDIIDGRWCRQTLAGRVVFRNVRFYVEDGGPIDHICANQIDDVPWKN